MNRYMIIHWLEKKALFLFLPASSVQRTELSSAESCVQDLASALGLWAVTVMLETSFLPYKIPEVLTHSVTLCSFYNYMCLGTLNF